MGCCNKFEIYFSELGRCKVWRGILLGQILSMLLSGKCILTTLLQSATWQFPPTGQLLLPYFVLMVIFMPVLACVGIRKSFSKAPWIGVGVALVGGAWSGQRLGISHVGGATAGLMAVGCIVWADVEGTPSDGRNQLVGDMLCLSGSLLFAVVTVIQEVILKKQSFVEYLAMIGLFGTVIATIQTFVFEYNEIFKFKWLDYLTLIQFSTFSIVQIVFQILMTIMLRDAGSVALHLSFVSSDYYTLMAGIYLFQFKFHGLYFLSYFLAMVGIFLFSARRVTFPYQDETEHCTEDLPQVVNDTLHIQDNISMEYTVPTLDCIPIQGLQPPMSRDTTFTSFLGASPHDNNANTSYNVVHNSISNHNMADLQQRYDEC